MTLLKPPEKHCCPTPAPYEYDYMPHKSLWCCDGCGKWWVGHEIRSHPGDRVIFTRGTVTWQPVRWWHFRLRRRIAERGDGA